MKGLSFTATMAGAVLAGRKTVTRRLMGPQPSPEFLKRGLIEAVPQWPAQDGVRFFTADGMSELVKSPYRPGERRCLLTTWAVKSSYDELKPVDIGLLAKSCLAGEFKIWHAGLGLKPEWCGRSRRGFFLPNTLRRLMPVLVIESVRVERVQDISEEDAIAEGAHRKLWITSPISAGAMGARGERGTHREGFKEIWEDINGVGSWALNPWVFVIGFRKLS